MSKIIVYKNEDETLSVMFPIEDCGLTVEDIAKKDVPKGKPYRILNSSELPSDDEFMAAWEIDMTNYDGIGLGYNDWLMEKNR